MAQSIDINANNYNYNHKDRTASTSRSMPVKSNLKPMSIEFVGNLLKKKGITALIVSLTV